MAACAGLSNFMGNAQFSIREHLRLRTGHLRTPLQKPNGHLRFVCEDIRWHIRADLASRRDNQCRGA